MASGDTKTEALLNILGNGGDASDYKGCCNTKTQSYILDAIDRVQNVEDEVEELKNNPDVVDIVDTYADLQAYDTTHLSNNDIIRVLADETHSGNSTYYRFTKNPDTWTFIGEIAGGGGGNAGEPRLLTTDDYNWNSSTSSATEPYNCIALWLLPMGYYCVTDYTLNVRDTVSTTLSPYDYNSYIITKSDNGFGTGERIQITQFTGRNITSNDGTFRAIGFSSTNQDGYNMNLKGTFLNSKEVITSYPLSNNDNKYMKVLSGSAAYAMQTAITNQGNTLSNSAPTTSTVGVLGQLYTDTTNMHTYQCTAISGNTYTWTQRW